MGDYTASGRPKASLSIPKVDLPEIIGPPEEEKPLVCDLCGKELILETPDDGTVAISPGGGTWNVCESCRTELVKRFPAPHSYEPPAPPEIEYDENGDAIFEFDGDEKEADSSHA